MPAAGFQTILCPIDFSEISANALRQASQLAECGDSRLVAMYANWFEAPLYFTESRIEELKRQAAEAAVDAQRSLNAFVVETLGDRALRVEKRIVEGAPAETIERLASDLPADLVVMGTHGRTGVNRWMLGSVAERVIRESAIPVLTTRVAGRGKMEHILVPVNDTELSRTALQAAAGLAAGCGAAVTVVHIQEKHADAPIANLCAWVSTEVRSRCSVREVVIHGDAAEEIVALAGREGCDLIIMGAPERHFFEGKVLSRTALRVIRHAPCAVLSIRQKG